MWQKDQAQVACLEQEIGAEWVPHGHPERHLMPLADRIKQLRTEAGLSQAELAERAGAGDARQISRYENGRITPSLDAIIHIAQALDVSIDYLVIDNMPRRPLHIDDHGLTERLAALAELDQADRDSMLSVLDAMITRKRVRALASGDTS
jgi:transcriptional regulator with XRE-family HTH domain